MSAWTQLAAEADATDAAVRQAATVLELAIVRGLLQRDPGLERDARDALGQLRRRVDAHQALNDQQSAFLAVGRTARPRRRTGRG